MRGLVGWPKRFAPCSAASMTKTGDSAVLNGEGGTRTAGLLAALVFLVALNLRPAIVAVGPLLSQIGLDLGWGESLQGLLGALPLLAFAAISPLVRFATARFSPDKVIFFALLVLAAGCLVRSAFDAVGVWLGTVAIGSAIAVGNVLVPVIVKRDYVDHVAMATGVYSACITSGFAIAGLTAGMAAEALGGWRPALALWAIPPLVVAALWLLRMRPARGVCGAGQHIEGQNAACANAEKSSTEPVATTANSTAPASVPLWRRPMTWFVTLFMGLQSAAFYTMSNWLPSIAAVAGFSSVEAGVQLFIFQALGILSGLVIPRFMYVRGNQVCAALLASAPMVIAGLGWIAAPQLSLVWSVIGGVGQGASLVVALTLISVRAGSQKETVALSGIAQSVGYLLASIGPFAFGTLVEISGGWQASLVLFTALAVAQCVVAVLAGRKPNA